MHKFFKAAIAATALGGATLAAVQPAEAHGDGGAAIAAGIIGLGVGAAIASADHPRYDGYYNGGYYGGGYAPVYGGGYYGGGWDRGDWHRGGWDRGGWDHGDRGGWGRGGWGHDHDGGRWGRGHD